MLHRPLLLAVLILVSALVGAAQVPAGEIAKIDAVLQEAIPMLPAPDRDGKDAIGGVRRLVDALVLAVPHAGFPAPFGEQVRKAQAALPAHGAFEGEAVAALNKAYKLAHGRDFVFDAGIKTIPDAVAYCSARLTLARDNLQAGKISEFAGNVLAVVLTIVTPMAK